MSNRHEILPSDLLPLDEYGSQRTQRRRSIAALKRLRRVAVGPYITFYFECYETMWQQVQEMLYIEKGGEAQISDELAAYNPLIPKGSELVATFMIEVDDPNQRKRILSQLGGIEESVFIRLNGETIRAVPELDQDRTTAEGKASSVQFVHFPFTAAQIAAFRSPGSEIILGLSHPNYQHMAVLPEETRIALQTDFD